MNPKIDTKDFIARMERKHEERVAGRRRIVGTIGSLGDFRVFTRGQRVHNLQPDLPHHNHLMHLVQ